VPFSFAGISSGNSSCGLRNSSVANFKVLIGLPCIFHLSCFFRYFCLMLVLSKNLAA